MRKEPQVTAHMHLPANLPGQCPGSLIGHLPADPAPLVLGQVGQGTGQTTPEETH